MSGSGWVEFACPRGHTRYLKAFKRSYAHGELLDAPLPAMRVWCNECAADRGLAATEMRPITREASSPELSSAPCSNDDPRP